MTSQKYSAMAHLSWWYIYIYIYIYIERERERIGKTVFDSHKTTYMRSTTVTTLLCWIEFSYTTDQHRRNCFKSSLVYLFFIVLYSYKPLLFSFLFFFVFFIMLPWLHHSPPSSNLTCFFSLHATHYMSCPDWSEELGREMELAGIRCCIWWLLSWSSQSNIRTTYFRRV